jgi:hypothetical protein
MATTREKQAQALLDKQAIWDRIMLYARGIDRRDWDLVRSCFSDGAVDEHGAFNGPLDEFVPWIQEASARYSMTMHTVGNVQIELDGDTAHAETYVTAYHRLPERNGEPRKDFMVGARWNDRLDHHEDDWLISHRQVVWDWNKIEPVGREWDFNENYITARRDRQDPVYDRPAFSPNFQRPTDLAGRIQELRDKQTIKEALYRYCRGVDRLDPELIRSCYYPDATDDHGTYQGDRDGFVRHAGDGLATMLGTMHFIGNVLVDVQDTVAYSESYCVAYHRMPSRKMGEAEHLVACRYVDRFERRAEMPWKLGDRTVAYEWSRIDPVGQQDEFGPSFQRGQRNKSDLIYQHS